MQPKITFDFKPKLDDPWSMQTHPLTEKQYRKLRFESDTTLLAQFCQQQFTKEAGYFSRIEIQKGV